MNVMRLAIVLPARLLATPPAAMDKARTEAQVDEVLGPLGNIKFTFPAPRSY